MDEYIVSGLDGQGGVLVQGPLVPWHRFAESEYEGRASSEHSCSKMVTSSRQYVVHVVH